MHRHCKGGLRLFVPASRVPSVRGQPAVRVANPGRGVLLQCALVRAWAALLHGEVRSFTGCHAKRIERGFLYARSARWRRLEPAARDGPGV